MNRRVIILVTFVVVLVLGYGTYTFDKRLDTLEEMIEQTAQEVKERPRPQIIGQPTPSRWPWEPSTDPQRMERRLRELERQESQRQYNERFVPPYRH